MKWLAIILLILAGLVEFILRLLLAALLFGVPAYENPAILHPIAWKMANEWAKS
jgi:hypothetical protein